MIPNEKDRQSVEKVIVLKESIVEECRKQDFTLNEVERLVEALQWEVEQVRRTIYTKAQF